MNLVAFVGNDRENLGQVTALINRMESEKIILVRDKGAPNLASNPKCVNIDVDSSKDLSSLKTQMQDGLKSHLSKDFEVAVSIASGSGKSHMALVSALINIPVGIKIAVFTKNGIGYLT